MPARIDQNLIPPVIRESVDPDILNRAQSIEWSINRDTGEDEHGFLDGSHEDYLTSQNLMPKTHGSIHFGDGTQKSRKQIEWSMDNASGRDSGYDQTPVSPSLKHQNLRSSTRSVSSLAQSGINPANDVDLSPLDDSVVDFSAGNVTNATGQMKRHPNKGMYPFPIYKVNQQQLQGDVFFEVAPRSKPGERTVHYEKSSRVMNEEDLDALGLDPNVFGPNSRTTMDEQEEELIETSVLKGGARELENIYNSMRNEAGNYFDRQRARSVSPVGNRINDEETSEKRTTIFGSMTELDNREQEFYPYRDAHQGKPLPGDNEYGTWGSRFDDKRQWKLCNGQWVRVTPPKPQPKPESEKYLAERIKCKPPKKMGPVKSEPVRTVKPQGSTDSDADSDDYQPIEQPIVDLIQPRRLAPRRVSLEPPLDTFRRQPKPRVDSEPPVDLDALRDKYRPKVAVEKEPSPDYDDNDDDDTPSIYNDDNEVDTKANPAEPTGTILLDPIPPPPEEIKLEPIQPLYVEMKKPLKQPEGEEEKMMEDPNLMWMHIGPAQYGPPFGTLKRRKAREEEWVGPPCELCHKQIEERRCMLAENMKFHCWHFACSFCLKTLKPADFLIAEADRKPYCLNCHKREFPEISLVNLKLEES